MNRRQFMLVLAAGGATIALTACDAMPPSAVAAWQGPPPTQHDPRLRALAWAMLAPNPHNLQSWVADIRQPGQIILHVDLNRLLPFSDPPNRQILVGCGAFLELLCMAATEDGYRTDIVLFPQGDYADGHVDQRPFAQLALVRDVTVEPDPLFRFVRERRTTRRAYDSRIPYAEVLDDVATAAHRTGIEIPFAVEPTRVNRLNSLAVEGLRVDFFDPACWRESAAVMHVGSAAVAAEPSGLALLGKEVWWGRRLGIINAASLRDPHGAIARRGFDDFARMVGHTSAWAWLTSDDNSRRTQLDAGRSYLRLALAVAQHGLAMHPVSQLLQEYPAMISLYDQLHHELGIVAPRRVQMLVRVGYAPCPEPAPRRAFEGILQS